MSAEDKNKPSIIRKPMKKEREKQRRRDLRQNEAPGLYVVYACLIESCLNILVLLSVETPC